MAPIESYEQYAQLVAEGKQLPQAASNCYFLPAVVKEKIAQGKLFSQAIPGGLLILEREASFFRCYYYLSMTAAHRPVDLPMPAVVEFVFQQAMNEGQQAQVAALGQMGFTLGRESGRMHLEGASAPVGETPDVCLATEDDVDAVYGMVEDNFDPLYAFIGTRDDFMTSIREGRVFVIRRDGVAIAALHAELARGTASIRHLVVSGTCRGRGYGRQLVLAYHGAFRDQIRSFFHWVDRENHAAIGVYTGLGYSFDGRCANEYIKK